MSAEPKATFAVYKNQSESPEEPKIIEVPLGYFWTLAEAQAAALNAKTPREGTPLVQIRYGTRIIRMG